MTDSNAPPNGGDKSEADRELAVESRQWDDSVTVSSVVLAAVSSVEAVDETKLDPLHHYVETESLDRLFQPKKNGAHRSPGTVTFWYHGYEVQVENNGPTVEVRVTDQ
jgi:hypothetical protein